MYGKYLFLAAFLFCASAAQAETLLFNCTYNSTGDGGWLSKEATYAVDKSAATMAVSDRDVLYANDGKALTTSLERSKTGVYVGRWTLELPARGNKKISVTYRVRIDEARGTAQASAVVGSSDTEPRAIAKCQRKVLSN